MQGQGINKLKRKGEEELWNYYLKGSNSIIEIYQERKCSYISSIMCTF
jgi:hypothetical protein